MRAAQEPEIIDILRACTNLRDQLLLLLLAETGFRIGEILGVDYTKDIDYEKQVLKVYFRDDNDNEARAKNAEYRSAKISRETSSSCCIIWRNTGGYCSGRASCLLISGEKPLANPCGWRACMTCWTEWRKKPALS